MTDDPRVTDGGSPLPPPLAELGQRRRPWLLWGLLAAAVLLPILEIVLLVVLGRAIGVWWTFGLLVAEAALGLWLVNREGRQAWRALVDALRTGRLPSGELADGALVLTGGILFILPGLITDAVGLVFLLPFTRPVVRRLVGAAIARRTGVPVPVTRARRDPGDEVIEGTVVDDVPPREIGH